MANVKLIFKGTENSKKSNLECSLDFKNEIYLEVYFNEDFRHEKRYITLDLQTAVRLVKTLKTAIFNAKKSDNGNK